MINYTYNSLDDYITINAEHLLDIDNDIYNYKIKALAFLGDIYAIQDWYAYNGLKASRLLDKNITNLEENTFNEVYALANYYSKDEETIEDYNYLVKNLKDLENKCKTTPRNTQEYIKLLDELDYIKKNIEKLPHIRLWYKGNSIYSKLSRAQKSPLLLLNGIKILDNLIKTIPFKFHKEILIKEKEERITLIFNDLYFKFNSFKKINPETYIIDNRELAFVVAYLIMTYDKLSNNKEIAVEILTTLCQKEYSTTYKKSYRAVTVNL